MMFSFCLFISNIQSFIPSDTKKEKKKEEEKNKHIRGCPQSS